MVFGLLVVLTEGAPGTAGLRIATPVLQREADQLKFDKFNVSRVLEHGSSLLGSAGTEYELDLEDSGMMSAVAFSA